MNTDCYFEIGYTHTICEDYALSGKINDDLVYAIVADGCSASDDVDVGARLLAYSARQILLQLYRHQDSAHFLGVSVKSMSTSLALRIATQADTLRKQLLLPVDVLDSTLLIAIGDKDGNSRVFCYGDGVAVRKGRDGDIFYCNYEYPSGAPYYLSYLLDPEKHRAYREKFGREEDDVILSGSYLNKEINVSATEFQAKHAKEGALLYEETSFGFIETEWIILLSDGATSYEQKRIQDDGVSHLEKRDFKEQLVELTDFKNVKGEFIKRKMNRLKKDHSKSGVIHYDDISVAGIILT